MKIRISYLESLFEKSVKKYLSYSTSNDDTNAFALVAHVAHIDPQSTVVFIYYFVLYTCVDILSSGSLLNAFYKLSLCIFLSDVLLWCFISVTHGCIKTHPLCVNREMITYGH